MTGGQDKQQSGSQAAVTDAVEEPSRLDRFAAISVLTLFAVTWPIVGLLGRNAEFFLARRSPKTEIIYLALFAALLVPLQSPSWARCLAGSDRRSATG